MLPQRMVQVSRSDGRPKVRARDGSTTMYDLVAVAAGVNAGSLKIFEHMDFGYRAPKIVKTFIQECRLGRETISRLLGSSMHVFLLDIPRLEFAAIIPKDDYVTVALLGEDLDKALVRSFLESPEVRACMPRDGSRTSNAVIVLRG